MAAAVAIPIIGGIMGAGGALMEASDKQEAYENEAQQLESNAKMTRASTNYNAMRQGMIADRKIGGIETAYGASGISSESATVLNVLAASRSNAEMDKLSILHEGDVRASGLEERARYDRSAGDRSKQMGYFNAFSSLFSGGSRAAGMMPSGNTTPDMETKSPGTDYGTAGGSYGPGYFGGPSGEEYV